MGGWVVGGDRQHGTVRQGSGSNNSSSGGSSSVGCGCTDKAAAMATPAAAVSASAATAASSAWARAQTAPPAAAGAPCWRTRRLQPWRSAQTCSWRRRARGGFEPGQREGATRGIGYGASSACVSAEKWGSGAQHLPQPRPCRLRPRQALPLSPCTPLTTVKTK